MKNAAIGGIVGIAFLGIVALSTVSGAFYIVDAGERGVVTRMGEIARTVEPGLGFKLPFIDSVHTFPVRSQNVTIENLESFTFDQQVATVEGVHIAYRIDSGNIRAVYEEYKTPEEVVARHVRQPLNEVLEKVTGQYTAERIVQERAKYSTEVTALLKSQIPGSAPIEITAVSIASIAFPDSYIAKVNERMNAEVEVSKAEQDARQQAHIKTKEQHIADAEAYKITSAAAAQAEAIRIKGLAEAEAIEAKSKALSQSPMLVDLTKAERWNGILPTSMIPGTAIPFIDVGGN
jgi:regulator of protease activity HflC (stomatin/prohibitin superfamily)